jgi:hypothetical protein
VTERAGPATASLPSRFVWPVPVLASANYHGVRLHFEVDPSKDLSAAELAWMEREGEAGSVNVQLEPVRWEIVGPREIYRYKDIHFLEYYNKMFHVGGSRYVAQSRASLYVFKERTTDLRFLFRGQEIVVPARRGWIPSVYHYSVDYVPEDATPNLRTGKKIRYTREILQVGGAEIETVPHEGFWFVNGRRHEPGDGKAIVLASAGGRLP